MSIVANKFPGVRAALCSEDYSAKMSRMHNDANLLVLPGRIIDGKGGKGRYLRTYTKGGSLSALNCWQEIEVYGLPAQ